MKGDVKSGNGKDSENFEELNKHGKIIVKRRRVARRGLNSPGKSGGLLNDYGRYLRVS